MRDTTDGFLELLAGVLVACHGALVALAVLGIVVSVVGRFV